MTQRQSERRWREAGWPTYREAKSAFRDMIRAALAGGLSQGELLDHRYDEMLDWLVDGHPDAVTLLERGVDGYTVLPTGRPEPGAWGLAVIDAQGWGAHPFSTHEALMGMRRSPRATLNEVMAIEVGYHLEVSAAQAVANTAACPETGEPLTKENAVGAYRLGSPSLEGLVSGFLSAENLDVEMIEVRGDVSRERHLADRDLAGRWCDHHAQYAKLEAVSRRGYDLRSDKRSDNPFHGMTT